MAIALCGFPLGCALWAARLGQDIDFDMLNYHVYNAYALLDHRFDIDILGSSINIFLSPYLDVAAYFLIRHVPGLVEGMIVGAVQGINPVLVYLIGRRAGMNRLLAFGGAVTATVSGGFAAELGNVMGDTEVSIPLLFGILLLVSALQRGWSGGASPTSPMSSDRPQSLSIGVSTSSASMSRGTLRRQAARWQSYALAGGFALGVGIGLKEAEFPFAVAAIIAPLACSPPLRRRISFLAWTTGGFVLGFAASFASWAIQSWQEARDPFALLPSTARIFPSPYLVSGGSFFDPRFLPRDTLQFIDYPVYWLVHPLAVAEIPIRELSIPLAYVVGIVALVLAILAGIVGRRRPAIRPGRAPDIERYLLAVLPSTLVIWEAFFGIYRYIIVLELVTPLILVCEFRSIGRSARTLSPSLVAGSSRARVHFAAACLIAGLACTITESTSIAWDRVGFGSAFIHVSVPSAFRSGREQVMIQLGTDPVSFIYPYLPRNVVSVGYLAGMVTPLIKRRVAAAIHRSRSAHGGVYVVFQSPPGGPPPTGWKAYAASIGIERSGIGDCAELPAYVGTAQVFIEYCVLSTAAGHNDSERELPP